MHKDQRELPGSGRAGMTNKILLTTFTFLGLSHNSWLLLFGGLASLLVTRGHCKSSNLGVSPLSELQLYLGHICHFKRFWLVGELFLLVKFIFVNVEALHNLIHVASVGCLQQHVDVHREFDCIPCRSRSKVVLASLKTRSPGVEVHG